MSTRHILIVTYTPISLSGVFEGLSTRKELEKFDSMIPDEEWTRRILWGLFCRALLWWMLNGIWEVSCELQSEHKDIYAFCRRETVSCWGYSNNSPTYQYRRLIRMSSIVNPILIRFLHKSAYSNLDDGSRPTSKRRKKQQRMPVLKHR